MINFDQDMKIDEDALDLELLNHSDLERKYIEECSEAFKEMKYAQEEVKTIRSKLIREANENPEKCCKKTKPNAADIEAFYRLNKEYQEVKEEAIEAEDRYLVLRDMKDDIHFTRTKALEGLVKLHSEEYFAGPRVPRILNKEKKNWQKTKNLKGGMRRRK